MAFIAAPVAAWAMGLGASAAVGAIAGAVAVGVVTGAVIGAATAVITGGNILQGALKGAIFGGISGGVMSGLGMALGFSSATSQLASIGLSPTGAALAPGAAVGATTGLAAPMLTGPEAGLVPSGIAAPGAIEAGTGAIATAGANTANVAGATTTGTSTTGRGFFDKLMFDNAGDLNPGVGKVISEGISGTAKALLTDDDKPETQSEYLQNVQALNVSGDFQARTANIKIPDYWKRYGQTPGQKLNQSTQAQIAPQQVRALTAQQQQGGAYAQPA